MRTVLLYLGWIVIGLAALAYSHHADSWLQREDRLRAAFQAEVSYQWQHLIDFTDELKGAPTLLHGLANNLSHALRQGLVQGRQTSEITSLALGLADGSGMVLAHSGPWQTSRFAELPYTEKPYWHVVSPEQLLLSYKTTFRHLGRSYWVALQQEFSFETLRERLLPSIADAGFQAEKPPLASQQIAHAGYDLAGRPVGFLVSKPRSDLHRWVYLQPKVRPLVYGAIMLATLLLWVWGIRAAGRFRKESQQALSWLQDNTLPAGSTAALQGTPERATDMMAAIQNVVQLYQNQCHAAQEHLQKQRQENTTLQQELADVHQKLGQRRLGESVVSQFQQIACHLRDLVKQLMSTLEDSGDILSCGIVGPLQNQQQVLNTWRRQLATASPRKVLRSLSETPTDSGSNLLYDQLHGLLQGGVQMANSSVSLLRTTKKTWAAIETLASTLDLWTELAGEGDANQCATGKVVATLDLVERMIFLTEGGHRLVFQRRLPDDLCIADFGDAMSHKILAAALFHLFSAVSLGWPSDQEVVVTISFESRDQTNYLLISGQESSYQFGYREEAEAQLRQGTRILAIGGVFCELLPCIRGLNPIAVSWPKKTVSKHQIRASEL